MVEPSGNDLIKEGEKIELKAISLINKLIERNIFYFDVEKIIENLPEFSKELKDLFGYEEKRFKEDKSRKFLKEIKKGLEEIKKILIRSGYLKEDGEFNENSFKIYASKIIGEIEKEIYGIYEYGKYISDIYGSSEEYFKKKYGLGDKYLEIDIKSSIRQSIKDKEIRFIVEKKKERKGGKYIILLDVSGSMYGEKIVEAKKSCIVLIEKILRDNNIPVLILFNDKIVFEGEIKKLDEVLSTIMKIFPNGSTDIALALRKSLDYIDRNSHIVIITDALPTFGEKPIEDTLNTVKIIRNKNSFVSIIGINLNEEGENIAKKIVEIGGGNLFIVKDIKELSKVLILDYNIFKKLNSV